MLLWTPATWAIGYTGAWLDSFSLLVTVTNVSAAVSADPVSRAAVAVGALQVTVLVAGGLTSLDGTSAPSNDSTVVTGGSWGDVVCGGGVVVASHTALVVAFEPPANASYVPAGYTIEVRAEGTPMSPFLIPSPSAARRPSKPAELLLSCLTVCIACAGSHRLWKWPASDPWRCGPLPVVHSTPCLAAPPALRNVRPRARSVCEQVASTMDFGTMAATVAVTSAGSAAAAGLALPPPLSPGALRYVVPGLTAGLPYFVRVSVAPPTLAAEVPLPQPVPRLAR